MLLLDLAVALVGVYPRVCGVDDPIFTTFVVLAGLSPRVRGRSGMEAENYVSVRFIPACAG